MVPEGIADVAPWPDWCSAAEGALRFLSEHVGWDVWMVTRVIDDRQVILLAYPEGTVRPGMEYPWEGSFCRLMVTGEAPRLATVTAAVPAYSAQNTGALSDVAAYVGVPLVTRDLELFGTLCGIAYRAKPRSLAREMDVVEAAARMLSTLLAAGMEPPQVTESPG